MKRLIQLSNIMYIQQISVHTITLIFNKINKISEKITSVVLITIYRKPKEKMFYDKK